MHFFKESPPLIVLMDILTLFIVMLMLQPNSDVKLKMPQGNVLPKGVHIVSIESFEKNATVLYIPFDEQKALRFDESVLQKAGAAYLIACLRDKRLCSTAKIPIDSNGNVDFEYFYELNNFDLRR